MGRVGGGLLSIGDQILYRLPSFIGLSFAGPRFWHNGDATAGGVLAMLESVPFLAGLATRLGHRLLSEPNGLSRSRSKELLLPSMLRG